MLDKSYIKIFLRLTDNFKVRFSFCKFPPKNVIC